ncbi:MAG: glycosyltransferase [Cyanobacteria bacterium J06626_18]
MRQPAVLFYVPPSLWPDAIPQDADQNWAGFGLGVYAWTIQTYLRLRDAGLPCALVDHLPEQGIVFLHRNGFQFHQRIEVSPRRLLVCFQADVLPHPDAQVHIVQNPTQENRQTQTYFMPHWSQPGLQPRAPERGDRFETVAFFGHTNNLSPEFTGPEWNEILKKLGLVWHPVVNTNRWNEHRTLDTRWNDYRQVDAVVAVRSFAPDVLAQTKDYCHKPATKLYNAWLAGVPAILGPESGYRAARQTDLDYLEVTSLAEVQRALMRLQEDPDLRQAMVCNGRARSRAIAPETLTQRWLNFIQDTLFPVYKQWCSQSPWQQQLRVHSSRLSYGARRLHQRWQDWSYSWGRG